MEVVLGIDAAWTAKEPSGVALIVRDDAGWRLIAACSSYEAFVAPPGGQEIKRHRGSVPDPALLVSLASAKAGQAPDLIAIDMPMSLEPISGRRASDNAVSRAYGSRHASTHTPSQIRPGHMSDDLRSGFHEIGYPLATTLRKGRALAEVYPHPALIELANADKRLPYKASKIAKYWPDLFPVDRKSRLIEMWEVIVALLEERVNGVAAALRVPGSDALGYEFKAFEDMLDAVVCAWVGACMLDGNAKAYGDDISAIWVPDFATRMR